MRRILILFAFGFFGLVRAQTPLDITLVKNGLDPKKGERLMGIIGSRTEGLCLVWSDKSENLFIGKLMPDNNIERKQSVPLGDKNKLTYILESPDGTPFYKLGNKYLYISNDYSQRTVGAYELDIKDGKIKTPFKNLATEDKTSTRENWNIWVSSNNSKLWIVQPYPTSKKVMQKVCTVFDENLKQIKRSIVDFGLERKVIDIMSYATDEKDLYCLYRKMDQNHSVLEIVKLNGETPEKVASFTMNDIDASSSYFRGYMKAELKIYKGSMSAVGYYAKDNAGVNGIFVCQVLNGKQEDVRYYPFDEALAKRYGESCKHAASHKKDYGAHSDELRLHSVTLDPDNGDLYITGQPEYDNITNQENYWYSRGNIYMARISQAGLLIYSVKIPNQRTNNHSVSYYNLLSNHKQYVLFCDSKDNTNSIAQTDKKPVELKVSANGDDVVVVIDEKGEMKRYLTGLSGGATDAYQEKPMQTDSNEFMFKAGKDLIFIKPR